MFYHFQLLLFIALEWVLVQLGLYPFLSSHNIIIMWLPLLIRLLPLWPLLISLLPLYPLLISLFVIFLVVDKYNFLGFVIPQYYYYATSVYKNHYMIIRLEKIVSHFQFIVYHKNAFVFLTNFLALPSLKPKRFNCLCNVLLTSTNFFIPFSVKLVHHSYLFDRYSCHSSVLLQCYLNNHEILTMSLHFIFIEWNKIQCVYKITYSINYCGAHSKTPSYGH